MISGNGFESGPLPGWVIVVESGMRLLGKRVTGQSGGECLCPVYELLVGMGITPQGQLTIQRQAIPMMTFASIESWTPRDDATVLELSRLSMHERRELLKAVLLAEQIVKSMRGAESGLTIATDMPRVDPKALLRKP